MLSIRFTISIVAAALTLGAGDLSAQQNAPFTVTVENPGARQPIPEETRQVIYYITIRNTSDDTLLIRGSRIANDLPNGWLSAICMGVCYAPDVSTTPPLEFPPHSSMSVNLHIYAGDAEGEGRVMMRYETSDGSSAVEQEFSAMTASSSVASSSIIDRAASAVPNPTRSLTTIAAPRGGLHRLQLFDAAGNEIADAAERIRRHDAVVTIDLSDLPCGLYRYHAIGRGERLTGSVIKVE